MTLTNRSAARRLADIAKQLDRISRSLASLKAWDEAVKQQRRGHRRPAAPRKQRTPWQVLGLREGDEILTAATVKASYRRLSKRHHPDARGSARKFRTLTEARDAMLRRDA